MNTGERRPNWDRTGQPGPREMATMLHWRELTLQGVPSLAGGVALRTQQPVARQPPQQTTKQMFAAGIGPIVRPPGVPDDHPKVVSGVYQ